MPQALLRVLGIQQGALIPAFLGLTWPVAKNNKQNPSACILGSCPGSSGIQRASTGLFTYHCLGLLGTWHQPLPGEALNCLLTQSRLSKK